MKTKATEIFASAPIPKAVLVNIVPSIVSMLMVMIYNLADTFFIGQTKDPKMLAAVSLATPLFLIFMAIGMLFGIGGTSLISRRLGEGNKADADHACSFCFWTSLGVGVIGMVGMIIFAEPLSIMVGAQEDTLEYVKQYLFIIAFGIPFLIVSNAFSHIIRAEGKANVAMAGMILGNVANIVLDPIMILGFGWNVAGAAVATVIGNVLSALFYLYHMVFGKTMLTINLKKYKAGGKIATGVLAIGIPASLNSMLMSTSNIIVNKLMVHYGTLAVAGLGVAMKVNMIAVMLLIGVGTGIQPLLGFNFGAGDRKRFMGILRFSLIFALALSAVMSIICYFGAGPMVSAFLDNKDAYAYGMQFARTLILSGPILGVLFVMINTIQSMGAAVPSLVLSISRQGLIYIPVLLTVNALFEDANLLVMAQPIADYMAVVLSVVLFIITFKRHFKRKDMTVQSGENV